MKTNAFRKLGQSVLVATVLTVFSQIQSMAQTTASAKPTETLGTMETAVYQVPETTKFKVHFINPSARKTTVKLLNAKDEVLYTEVVTNQNYIRKFDLENLADGMYHFEISNGQQKIRKDVELQTTTARNVQIQ